MMTTKTTKNPTTKSRRSSSPSPKDANPTLIAALEGLIRFKWAGQRGVRPRAIQLRKAIETLCELTGIGIDKLKAEDVTQDIVAGCVDLWLERGLANGTINQRLALLRMARVNVEGCRRSSVQPLKWYLTPQDQERLLTWLRCAGKREPYPDARILADYIEFVTYTGLRVEEALRLRWSDVRGTIQRGENGELVTTKDAEITVPGTKTASAQATLALGLAPAMLLHKRAKANRPGEKRVFPISYARLRVAWLPARRAIGAKDNPLATLKAIRRSAARHLTTKGCLRPS